MVKILYVDDEKFNLLVFKHSVNKDVSVTTALSGQEGLSILASDPGINAVVSDMRMPNMNGIDFIKKAKQMYPNMPFYILTGFDINEQIDEAVKSGLIVRYFNKPFNISEIEESIKSNLRI